MLKPPLVAALAFALAAPALAQTAAPSTTMTPGATTGPTAMAQGQFRAKAIMDWDVYSSDGHEVGEVEDLILDAQGRVVGVVVEVDRGLLRSDRHVMIPFERLRMGNNRRAELPMTRDEVRAMPGFDYRD
ncbi:PRC-barrel domain-containing protein [Sabulicella glaciei]|uniref:PRC-barrel domain-containing protein n=1 Tax=Sabulicella glaciei TaxID=2984948 RepID=A0ABT3P1F4_9PROT|nr:PRC-barrel domain-containing protein [Roseococcus sp. MDT2-1-1]MCW8088235.1 PRC-barrel domain-containing protein [Roseococcus sp. MDT2-1-1]